ncbi:pleckstrin homology domain-containing family A member 7 isoform X6 [Chiloscyllium plagiosum]|uniref:pleckstrin homology domain-containing family A member 7 isoform X6 n=1 Tax=Chiloscyllium plagiosum TaxID=36176 RepID=UPI001CB7DBC9|nr:pleckstrin homology domain-containing family A member 7 isoform X6 [Chiloscyllium plagiosum]
MAAELRRETLPAHWSYGVCEDGRIFFIDDQTRTTTWLHPRTGEPVNSGHMIRSDLPRGWEEGFTEEGASYFINHNQRTSSFRHPVTGQISPENTEYILKEQPNTQMSRQQTDQRPQSMISETSTAVTVSTVDPGPGSKVSKPSGKIHSFGKREQSSKRNPNAPVVVRGWLYKQDSSGMRLWKRRWFALSEYCLFYYKDSREETVLGSIPLPSYVISPVDPEDHISRKYAFKATHTGMRTYMYSKNSVLGSQADHSGMRTYYFSADTQEDMNGWIRAMNQAALMQAYTLRREPEKAERPRLTRNNYINSYKGLTKAEVLQSRDSAGRPRDEKFGFEKYDEIKKDWDDEERYGFQKEPMEILPQRVNKNKMQTSSMERDMFPQRRPLSHPQSAQRNGTIQPPTSAALIDQNGADLYRREFGPGMETAKNVQRKSSMVQVEHWVKSHKGGSKSHASAQTLPHRTLSQPQPYPENYQTLPKNIGQPSESSLGTNHNLPSDYKYAQDRVSHLKMSNEDRKATKEGTVWQLYEWQQRQQFKHGSPTAPLYPSHITDFDSGLVKSAFDVPRSISVPPSPSEIPPPGPPKAFSPRRPHTPAERVTVKPSEKRPAEIFLSGSPRRTHGTLTKSSAHIDRRSMPPMGYMTHTVSAPSLHGKTPEELTLLLIRLRRHQSKLANVRNHTFTQLQLNKLSQSNHQADDTYMQLKKNLEYLDLKMKSNIPLINMVHRILTKVTPTFRPSFQVTGQEPIRRVVQPVKIAESNADAKLSRLCERDKSLQDLEAKVRQLKADKDKLESVLEVTHRQLDQYKGQPTHTEKIAYQQRLLQEDLVQIRAEISKVCTELENAWKEYEQTENDVNQLKEAILGYLKMAPSPQDQERIRKDLRRIEDVMAGLSVNKNNYKMIIESIQNPERETMPSVPSSMVPSVMNTFSVKEGRTSMQLSPSVSPVLSPPEPVETQFQPQQQPVNLPPFKPQPLPQFRQHLTVLEDQAPPRPPLPHMYSPDDEPPAVPPLPKDATVIRHTSVRGLKRQSDERKRDREFGQYLNGDYKTELRTYMSEPELISLGNGLNRSTAGAFGLDNGLQTLPGKGLSSSNSGLQQSSTIASFVTLRRKNDEISSKERPKSALERLYGEHQRGRMSAEEQLERMKKHQKALVRERKRTLSLGERHSTSSRTSSRPVSVDAGSWKREQEFDLQLLEKAVKGEHNNLQDGLIKQAVPAVEADVEPLDYDLDLSKELSKPDMVLIPERYIELEPEEPLSNEEWEARRRKVQKIKNILSKLSYQNVQPGVNYISENSSDLDSQLQERERIITMSYALASEASQRSKIVAAQQQVHSSSAPSPPHSPLSNGFHYTFV